MSSYVVHSATMECSLGTSSSTLNIPVGHQVYLRQKFQANASDAIPNVNIPPFGLCLRSDPPPPCTPATQKWIVTKTDVIIDVDEAVMDYSICKCSFGGIISITDDGQ